MIKETKFFTGRLNADSAYQAFADTDLVNVFNAVFSNNRSGKTGRLEFIPGTRNVPYSFPSGGGFIIGTAVDIPKNRVYFLRKGGAGEHGIYCLDESGITKVIESSDITGGLAFDGVDIVNGARVVGDVLYWNLPGVYNGQQRINVEAAMKASNPSYQTEVEPYTFPLESSAILLYRRQPAFAPAAVKVTQTSPTVTNNYVVNNDFQFSYRYVYRDGEESRMSPYSRIVPFNKRGDTFNSIDVDIPVSEKISQDVQSVDLLVRYGNSGGFFIVKSWNKNKTSDATAISNHNAGTTPLTFRFYNDQIGLAVSESYSAAQFDSIPLSSETMEFIRNRIFLGNNTEGYDSPKATSISASAALSSNASQHQWFLLTLQVISGPQAGTTVTKRLLRVEAGGTDDGYYEFSGPSSPQYPPTVAWGQLTKLFTYESDLYTWAVSNNFTPISFNTPNVFAEITGGPPSLVFAGTRCMKSGATYQPGVVFMDREGRKCGVVEGAKVYIPERNYGLTDFVKSIDWTLSNAAAVNEIPEWAHYYIPVLTRCLTTTFFIQRRAVAMTYVDRDANGVFTFASSTYSDARFGIGVDISDLSSIGFGYTFQDGDIVKLYRDDNSSPVSLRVVTTSGRWVVCELANLGTLNASTNMLYELYTPYSGSLNEFFYEQGSVYQVNNPGLINRTYSITAGSFNGDVYLVSRSKAASTYLVEAMSCNDVMWDKWHTDAGRPNIIDNIGQRVKKSNISFSNTRIPETGVNGLSSFDPLDETNNVPAEAGAIRKLIAASRTVSDGTVMLCICEADTASIYIGETQVRDNAGASLLATSDGVIGTINPLRGGFGTKNPESVQSFNGNVFWWDLNRASVVMYGGNGLERVSDYGMAIVFRKFADDYQSWLAGNHGRAAYPGRGLVVGHINPNDGSYYITLPKLFWDTDAAVFEDMVLEEL